MTHLLLAVIYLSFISLGLPDALLGAAWPTIYPEFGTAVSCAGIISMIIAAGTAFSSLLCDRLTRRLGTGAVMTISVALTAAALLGFSCSHSFGTLCLWAVPYGLGAGCVDASLNNYVALHFTSRHMSWLHCMWGIGAAAGPAIMGSVLTGGQGWRTGYLAVSALQLVLTMVLFISLPLWKCTTREQTAEPADHPLTLAQIVNIPGVKPGMAAFFCCCALEHTTSLWASSYLVLHEGVSSDTAAFFGSLFLLGITAGRALSGFLTLKFNNAQMIRLGQTVVALGLAAMLAPGGRSLSLLGFVLIGLGCAPIYPCLLHSIPTHFGTDRSQAVIGVLMACAHAGNCLMPPLFGWIADHISVALFPVFLLALLVLMTVVHCKLLQKAG